MPAPAQHNQENVFESIEAYRQQLAEWNQQQAHVEKHLQMLRIYQQDLQVLLEMLREQRRYLQKLRQEAKRYWDQEES